MQTKMFLLLNFTYIYIYIIYVNINSMKILFFMIYSHNITYYMYSKDFFKKILRYLLIYCVEIKTN